MTDPDAEPLVLRSTYLLRRHESSWQIVAYLNHQDLKAMLATRPGRTDVRQQAVNRGR